VFESINHQLELMNKWINHKDIRLKRAGWNMGIVLNHDKKFYDEIIKQLLPIIELNLQFANDMYQFAMNRCMCEIGIKHNKYTEQCLSIGERLGVYKDMKVSKGCTSAFASIWISVVRKKYKKD
jgi:3-methyladenine DNA glycosylase AlkD